MNKQQRIVVWVVASVLSAICIVNGVTMIGDYRQRYHTVFWILIFPVLLMGAATFLHFMRRKE